MAGAKRWPPQPPRGTQAEHHWCPEFVHGPGCTAAPFSSAAARDAHVNAHFDGGGGGPRQPSTARGRPRSPRPAAPRRPTPPPAASRPPHRRIAGAMRPPASRGGSADSAAAASIRSGTAPTAGRVARTSHLPAAGALAPGAVVGEGGLEGTNLENRLRYANPHDADSKVATSSFKATLLAKKGHPVMHFFAAVERWRGPGVERFPDRLLVVTPNALHLCRTDRTGEEEGLHVKRCIPIASVGRLYLWGNLSRVTPASDASVGGLGLWTGVHVPEEETQRNPEQYDVLFRMQHAAHQKHLEDVLATLYTKATGQTLMVERLGRMAGMPPPFLTFEKPPAWTPEHASALLERHKIRFVPVPPRRRMAAERCMEQPHRESDHTLRPMLIWENTPGQCSLCDAWGVPQKMWRCGKCNYVCEWCLTPDDEWCSGACPESGCGRALKRMKVGEDTEAGQTGYPSHSCSRCHAEKLRNEVWRCEHCNYDVCPSCATVHPRPTTEAERLLGEEAKKLCHKLLKYAALLLREVAQDPMAIPAWKNMRTTLLVGIWSANVLFTCRYLWCEWCLSSTDGVCLRTQWSWSGLLSILLIPVGYGLKPMMAGQLSPLRHGVGVVMWLILAALLYTVLLPLPCGFEEEDDFEGGISVYIPTTDLLLPLHISFFVASFFMSLAGDHLEASSPPAPPKGREESEAHAPHDGGGGGGGGGGVPPGARRRDAGDAAPVPAASPPPSGGRGGGERHRVSGGGGRGGSGADEGY